MLVFFAYFSDLLPGWGAALVGVPLAVWSLLDEPRRGPLPAYQRLLAAHGACRHYEVLRLAEELRSMEPALTTLARRDVDFRAAGALWALERDAEAEALVRLHAAMGEKAWRTRRACSLAYAHRREAVEEMRRAAALAPSRGEDRIELAQMVLEHEGAVSEARALLNRGQTLNPIAIAFRSMVSGRVAIEEEDYERARSELRRAARWVRWLPLGPSRPEMDALIDVHICMADALAGRPVSAALLERSRAQLERSGRSDLLVRCERALADRRIAYR